TSCGKTPLAWLPVQWPQRFTKTSLPPHALAPPGLQSGVEARVDAARIMFVDLVAVFGTQVGSRLDVGLRVVVTMPGLRVDSAHRADHLAGEQDVFDRNDLRQQIDAGLVVDARIEEDVFEEMIAQQGPLQHLRQAAIAAPVIGCGAAAMRNYHAQGWKIL